jgi:hypothetical protein
MSGDTPWYLGAPWGRDDSDAGGSVATTGSMEFAQQALHSGDETEDHSTGTSSVHDDDDEDTSAQETQNLRLLLSAALAHNQTVLQMLAQVQQQLQAIDARLEVIEQLNARPPG